jgi:hypothetical protein
LSGEDRDGVVAVSRLELIDLLKDGADRLISAPTEISVETREGG